MRFRFGRRAEADPEEITAYIAGDNPARAVSFVRELREQSRRLAAFPEAARLRPDLGEGVRLSVSGNYVIIYVMHPDLMENPAWYTARETSPISIKAQAEAHRATQRERALSDTVIV
jgi:toxin ParE1/3/4